MQAFLKQQAYAFLRMLMVGTSVTALSGCGSNEESPERADFIRELGLSFDEFEANTYREPETGLYIVDGDIPLETREQLKQFYEAHVRAGALIVNQAGGVDTKWSDAQKLELTYCVSTSFGTRYAAVVDAMRNAAIAWQQSASIRFVHVSSQDPVCDASNLNVLFDVRPTSGQGYLARAFFPNYTRANSNVLIDSSAFGQIAPYTLTGILRHELGHTLGFRHEHTRPEARTCFEDTNWRSLTSYDPYSAMHYPQCNGGNRGDLYLTSLDQCGSTSLYGGNNFCSAIMDWGYGEGRAWVDFNGDGKADYCRVVGSVNGQSSYVACTVSTGTGFGGTYSSGVLDWGYGEGRAWVDFNGDGKADYCRVVGSVNGQSSYVACTVSTGTGFGGTYSSGVLDWGYGEGRAWVDFNGDGRADYCRRVGSVNGQSSYVSCTASTGTGFGGTYSSGVLDWGYDAGRAWADFNGDGRADYCRVVGSVNGQSSYVACTASTGTGFGGTYSSGVLDWGYGEGRAWADFNGDGRADYCRVVGSVNGQSSYVACTASTGTGFGGTYSSGVLDWGYGEGRAWADFNGDGRADYCRRVGSVNGQSSYVACTASTGTGFGGTYSSGVLDWGYGEGRTWADFNGDGRADYCRIVGSVNGQSSLGTCTTSP